MNAPLLPGATMHTQPTITKHARQAKHNSKRAPKPKGQCDATIAPTNLAQLHERSVWVLLDDEWLPGGGGSVAQAAAALTAVFSGQQGCLSGAAAAGLLTWDQLAWEQLIALNLAKAGADGADGVELTSAGQLAWSHEFLEARKLLGRIRVAVGAPQTNC